MDPWAVWLHASCWNRDVGGYIASGLVLASFSMKSMRALRLLAISSNVAFIFYALAAELHPILVLHVTLLPLNIVRLAQMEMVAAATRRAHHPTRLIAAATARCGNG